MLETDLISERFYLKQDGEFGIFYNTDIPHYTTDQGGHIDGAFAGDHLLPMSKHGPDWRTTDLFLPMSKHGPNWSASLVHVQLESS